MGCPPDLGCLLWRPTLLFPRAYLIGGALGAAWEAQRLLRRRVQDEDESHMTRWLNKRAVGVPSVKAMLLNSKALTCLAEWYCPTLDYPKSVPIDVLRNEATCIYKEPCSNTVCIIYCLNYVLFGLNFKILAPSGGCLSGAVWR